MDENLVIPPEDWPPPNVPADLAPVWFEPAVIVTTWRFEAAGQVWFVQQQDADEATARALFDNYTAGGFPSAVATSYRPNNLELEADWTAGGFTVIARE